MMGKSSFNSSLIVFFPLLDRVSREAEHRRVMMVMIVMIMMMMLVVMMKFDVLRPLLCAW